MDKFIGFFTPRRFSAIEFFYVIFGVSLIAYILFRFLPEEKSKKIFKLSKMYDWDEYDYDQTFKKSRNFAIQLLLYSSIILILSYIIGDIVADIGVWVFFPLTLILNSIRGNPVKKKDT